MTEFLKVCKYFFKYAFFFSLFINLLQLTFSFYMLLIFDKVLVSGSLATLWVLTIGALLGLCVLALLDWVRSRLLVRAGIEFDNLLNRRILDDNLANAAMPSGSERRATMREVQILRNYLGSPAVFAFFDLPWMPLYFIIVFILHPILGVVGMAGALMVLCFGIFTERVARRRLNTADDLNVQTGRFLQTALANASIVRAMGMGKSIASRWRNMNSGVVNLQSRVTRQTGVLYSVGKSCRMAIQVVVYATGAYLAVTHVATAGIMIAASIVIGRALGPIDQGMASYKQTLEAWKAYKSLKKTLDSPETERGRDLDNPAGSIGVEELTFTAREHEIVKGLSFQMPAGQSLALIGPSAAGKSTLCKLLLGIWRPTTGRVLFDGEDLLELDPVSIGRHIGYLPQTVELFNGTIAENIARMGKVDSPMVVEAASMAGVHQMILQLPKGYDTPVMGHGFVLSGGQRQRIGLARALYGNPRIVVLDEPNSNLDDEGDYSLLLAIARLREVGTTLILVTHKMNILSQVDNILVLREGSIDLCGPRDKVLEHLSARQAQAQAAAQAQAQAQAAAQAQAQAQPSSDQQDPGADPVMA